MALLACLACLQTPVLGIGRIFLCALPTFESASMLAFWEHQRSQIPYCMA